MKEIINFLKFEDREYTIGILKTYAKYIDNNVEEKCSHCKYSTCSEYDECFDGILGKLVDDVFAK